MKKYVLVLIAVAIVTLFLFELWGEEVDARLQATQSYNDCIVEEYQMTPVEYYQQVGEYPLCTQ